MKYFLIIIFICLFLPYSLRADKTGTTGGEVFGIMKPARFSAMGETSAGILSNDFNLYINPGMLGFIKGYGVLFTHTELPAGIRAEDISGYYSFPGILTLGGYAGYVNFGDIQEYLEEKNAGLLNYGNYVTGKKFTPSAIVLALGGGMKIRGKAGLGLVLSGYREDIYSITASAGQLKAGGILLLSKKLNMGLNLNLPLIKEKYTEASILPFKLKIGAGFHASKTAAFCMDCIYTEDTGIKINTGVEFNLLSRIYFRAGYVYKTYQQYSVWTGGLASGIGIKHERFSLDYSFNSVDDVLYIHRLTVGLRFKSAPRGAVFIRNNSEKNKE